MLEVFIGSGLGGVIRYYFGLLSTKVFSSSWQGTLFVNVIGSLLIMLTFQKLHAIDNRLSKIFIIGFLGGFTTFSSMSLDILKAIDQGQIYLAAIILTLNILLGVIMGILIFR